MLKDWLLIDGATAVNMNAVTHVDWWDSGGCTLWLGYTVPVDEGTAEQSAMADFVEIEDPKRASLLRDYIHAHACCLSCFADTHGEDEDEEGVAVLLPDKAGQEVLQ